MTKEEYKLKWSNYIMEESRLEKERKQMEADYIEEHKQFDKGDKVRITANGFTATEGIVYRIYCSDGNISYNFLQVKKDGTHSQRNLYLPYRWQDDSYKYELIKKLEKPKTETI